MIEGIPDNNSITMLSIIDNFLGAIRTTNNAVKTERGTEIRRESITTIRVLITIYPAP